MCQNGKLNSDIKIIRLEEQFWICHIKIGDRQKD